MHGAHHAPESYHYFTKFISVFQEECRIPSRPQGSKQPCKLIKKSQPDDMRVRLGYIQGNGAQRVCGTRSGTCAVLCSILSKRGILGTAELSRCLRQKQAKRSRGKHSDRILWMKQGAVFGAALRFSQAGTAPRRENRPSARGTRSVFCKGTMMPAAKAGNRNQRISAARLRAEIGSP